MDREAVAASAEGPVWIPAYSDMPSTDSDACRPRRATERTKRPMAPDSLSRSSRLTVARTVCLTFPSMPRANTRGSRPEREGRRLHA